MKANMGLIDRIVRVIVSIVLVALYLNGQISGGIGIGLLIIAGIFTLTALVSVCPLYLPFGIRTNKKQD